MSDFPDVVEVFSSNSSEHYRSEVVQCFGRYVKIEGETSQGKPVWKHESKDRVFHSDIYGYWCLGTPNAIIDQVCGYITGQLSNKDIENSGVWRIYDYENQTWQDDHSIIVKGLFLTMKTVCTLLSRLCISDSWEKGSSC